jgi:hypothetical protein
MKKELEKRIKELDEVCFSRYQPNEIKKEAGRRKERLEELYDALYGF